MAEERKFWDLNFEKINPNQLEEQDHGCVMAMDNHDDNAYDSISAESSMEDSSNSVISSSSTDLLEDASSSSSQSPLSSSTNSSTYTNKPLYDLSELLSQLPIKRGLSKFYHGKSQSYTSLATVKSLEDLAKKVKSAPSRSRMKSSKSYAAVVDGHKSYSPKATISKKSSGSRGSFLSF